MQNISNFPVMPRQCPSCPFRTDADGRHPDPELVSRIQQRCFSEASQICHHPRTHGNQQTHLCRGARDFQIQIFYRLGVLKTPTDKAWEDAKLNLLLKPRSLTGLGTLESKQRRSLLNSIADKSFHTNCQFLKSGL